MTEQEYTKLLDYLLTQLRDLRINEIVEEISAQINRGKTITLDDLDLKDKKIKQSEIGKTQTLPLTSKEAFEIATDYLSKIIIEVPSFSNRISNVFGSNVTWEYDQTQSIQSLKTTDSFSLTTISYKYDELLQASAEIQLIKSYIRE